MVAHPARDMEHSSPAAADGHHAARVRHPLDPLDAGEIRRAVEILRRERPVTPEARFVSVTLSEPPKDQVEFATPDRPAPGQPAGPCGEVCVTCGGVNLRRAGSCLTCQDCGTTTGCA